MTPDDPVLPPGVLAIEYLADDVVPWTTDHAIIYRCPWCRRNLFSQNTDQSLHVDIECRGIGLGHVLRYRR